MIEISLAESSNRVPEVCLAIRSSDSRCSFIGKVENCLKIRVWAGSVGMYLASIWLIKLKFYV